MRDTGISHSQANGDVVLGDDWIVPEHGDDLAAKARRKGRGLLPLRGSPLARKIITFNLIALAILVTGILYLNTSRDRMVRQYATTLVSEARLVADVFAVRLPEGTPDGLAAMAAGDVAQTLRNLHLRKGIEVFLFDSGGQLIARSEGTFDIEALIAKGAPERPRTPITDALEAVWTAASGLLSSDEPPPPPLEERMQALARTAIDGIRIETGMKTEDGSVLSAATPILRDGRAVGIVTVASPAGEIETATRVERERILQMFIVALLVSVGLSLVLASTIANPLADLAEAAELGRDRNARRMNPGRIRIPDLSARPDEIGRLSRALRGMVSALYNRIDSNEQFAADVAHEIKNPLASLQSAVGTLRMVKRDDQREKLLDVIEHDVRRLDRLVSDISNASRLDAELVKEEEETFDLLEMLRNLNQYLGEDARNKGIDYITDLPPEPIMIDGLEARLAQVFVNLITNAISFCEEGDAIRVWARRRQNRVLVVVEDTGPGIPEEALSKIFKRFYSQRPPEHFGNNSGLGLAISKQIVEAHGGVIWAENIRPTEADVTSEPLGARFVVGLPL